MRECSNCGATWEEGNICPYCKSVNYKEKNIIVNDNMKKKTGKTAMIVLAVSLSFLTATVIGVIYFSYSKVMKIIPNQNSYDYSSESSLSESNKAYQKEKGIYTGGILEVGKDIPEGEYLLMPPVTASNTYFFIEIFTDAEANDDSNIFSERGQNCAYVELEKGTFIDASYLVIYDIDKNDIELDPFSYSGMYKVGRDLDAGTYKIKSDGDYSVNYSIYKSLNSIAPVVKESGYLDREEYIEVTLTDGEYIEIINGHLYK